MMISRYVLLAALFGQAAAFVVPKTSAMSSSSSSTVLYDSGMDAYEAQMRSLMAQQPQQQYQGTMMTQVPPTSIPTTSSTLPFHSQPMTSFAQSAASTTTADDTTLAPAGSDHFKASPRWRKKTKQVATLGPASSSLEMIETLFLAGADVFRLNFSHGAHAEKAQLVDRIRQVEGKYDHPIAILGDLQGPKLRVGSFANPDGEMLQAGQAFRFDTDSTTPGSAQRVQLPHPEILQASQPGHVLLVDDGKVKLRVTDTGPGFVDCVVEVPGRIKDKKGVNTPDAILDMSPLTDKDRADLAFMLTLGVDWVALSFVQRSSDIEEIQRLILSQLPEHTVRPKVMAKIEKPSCFEGNQLHDIVALCDGIMVARGDLGVECAPEDVPLLQKAIIDESRRQGKPVVVATQMLESMIDSPTPTRAEASDVATAIYDGADAIMLSAESAAGAFPQESVLMQQRIINRVENDSHYQRYLQSLEPSHDHSSAAALMLSARQIARMVGAKAVVTFTVGGTTALRASKKRPDVPILSISPLQTTSRQLALSWGVYPECSGEYDTDNFRDMLRSACEIATRKGLVSNPNDLLVVTAGFPFGTPGAANVLRIIPAAGPTHWDDSL